MKKPVSATIDEELIKWIDREIDARKKFRNRSHLIESAIEMLKKEENQDNKKTK